MHHHPSYLQQPPRPVQAAQDDRSTSPTVVVTTSQVMKESHETNNPSPSPSTEPNSSANTTPLSGDGAAAAAYAAIPNPVQSYYQLSDNHQGNTMMETIDGTARPTTPSMLHYHHSHPGSRDPLSSPMSAPAQVSGGWNFSAPSSTNNTPIPSEIHTSQGPVPYFPSALKNSTSSTSISSKSTTKSVQVTGRKKHAVKSSASATSLSSNNPDDELLVSENGGTGGVVTARRQKRLERNRESARLSRRRRKQYLEVLEERVAHLSLEMDKGRRDHASQAFSTIKAKRSQVLEQALTEWQQVQRHTHSQRNLEHSLWLLEEGPLSRCSISLLVLATFHMQQLRSYSLPSECKFTLWLTLQDDVYYRGGRAASERLSAARIGERMLASGNDKVTPTNSMWPLVCNEVGLSYDQEERVRQYQRTLILQDPNTWLDRHTARASSLVMQSFHDAVGSMSAVLGQRERKVKQILTPEQRLKFLSWANNQADRIKSKFLGKRQEEEYCQSAMSDSNEHSTTDARDDKDSEKENTKYQIDKAHHLAANLYILNHRLQNVLKDYPFYPPVVVTPTSLKKLSRRPSFESLGQQKDAEARSLSRDTSFASMGSLKTSASNLSLGGSSAENLEKMGQPHHITPKDGELAAAPTVDQYLGFIKPIIPPIPAPRMTAPLPVHTSPSHSVPAPYATTSAPAPSLAVQPAAPTLDYTQYAPYPATVLPAQQPQQYTEAPQYQGQQIVHYQHQPPPQPQAPQSQLYMQQQQQQTYQQPPESQYYSFQAEPTAVAPPPYAALNPTQGYTPVPSPLDSFPLSTAPSPFQQQPEPSSHTHKSSFLPQHLNVVPEDMFPGGDAAAEDFFVGLMDGAEDWAIGEGIDMDTTS
ncbi:bZIP transcription factor [Nitzschia inconspicua]|uniref:BZIP transcription factor n=1 Tax=Nitzschia inconspicua TaxID=303405 RepID=A0A9K3LQQ8_9STRA|nr:bZIP transcription factor [Nitzschia inconspicua]KAG7366532.1 bZIP transcription factor [Nitzschia inconspicua]